MSHLSYLIIQTAIAVFNGVMRPCRSVSRIAHQGLTRSKTTLVEDAFGIPPQHQIRRVVVTGLGLVTPLGIGLQRAWGNLLVGHCGISQTHTGGPTTGVKLFLLPSVHLLTLTHPKRLPLEFQI